jgi:hypothetical protein
MFPDGTSLLLRVGLLRVRLFRVHLTLKLHVRVCKPLVSPLQFALGGLVPLHAVKGFDA